MADTMEEKGAIGVSDRLSFDTVQEPVAEQNRLFIIVAIGLVGMLVLGLLGIGGYVVFARTKHATAAHTPPTAAVAFIAAGTATPTVMATNTPVPTVIPLLRATNTPVVLPPTPTVLIIGGALQPTATPIILVQPTPAQQPAPQPEQPQPEEAPPQTGFGMGAIGVGAGLAALAFIARRLRLSS
jgi:heme/copper-type cytochrome/quinol oxidase subunit 2